MKKEKLMILGAGLCQVPIINLVKQKGFEAIVVSAAGNYPGFNIADKSYQVDVRNKEEILDIARREKISGILTDQTDLPVPTVAYVAERMGLPGIGYECALNFTNKYKMRQLCEKVGVPVPKHFSATSIDEAEEKADSLGYPLILKPVDSQGSRGVALVNGPQDLAEKFHEAQKFSACNSIILEEFFRGHEVVVQGIVSDYKFRNLVIADRYYFDLPDIFIPAQTIFPSVISDNLKEKIFNLNSLLIDKFHPQFGITHSEYLVDAESGEVRLVETAIRGGGVFISSDLVPLACGVNINELLIQLTSGATNVSLEENILRNGASAYLCFHLPVGIIQHISGVEEIKSFKGVHKVYLQDLEVGQKTALISDKTMRKGPILLKGSSRQDLEETLNRVKNTLNIRVETPKGIKGIEW